MMPETLSQTDLLDLPLIAFILFFTTFLIVVVRVLVRGSKDPRYVALSRLPLDSDVANPTESSREP